MLYVAIQYKSLEGILDCCICSFFRNILLLFDSTDYLHSNGMILDRLLDTGLRHKCALLR